MAKNNQSGNNYPINKNGNTPAKVNNRLPYNPNDSDVVKGAGLIAVVAIAAIGAIVKLIK